MLSPLVECVPNISEGKDLEKIEQIVDAVRKTDGCTVLGVEPDHDYHRTVITFAGAPDAVVNGAVALIEKSIELLDMQQHQGEHPPWRGRCLSIRPAPIRDDGGMCGIGKARRESCCTETRCPVVPLWSGSNFLRARHAFYP